MRKQKRDKIVYWVSTIWLSLGMFATGLGQLIGVQSGLGGVEMLRDLHYPVYLLPLLGILKIGGVLIILLPGLRGLKEWSYAGFCFLMIGAIFSHISVEDPMRKILPALVLLILAFISWYFRPESKTLVQINSFKQSLKLE